MSTAGPDSIQVIDLPVRRTDPMPIGTLGMWFFIASEAMFFVAMLGAFVVLKSTGTQHDLFVRSARMLHLGSGVASAGLLILSSVALFTPRKKLGLVAMGASMLFILLQILQWNSLLNRHTIVYREQGSIMACDGHGYDYRAMVLSQPFDLHAITPDFFTSIASQSVPFKRPDQILQDLSYGPSRNNFFASYFLMSAAHLLHLLGGIIALLYYLVRKIKTPVPLQNYWHFVNIVGIIGLACLYFA